MLSRSIKNNTHIKHLLFDLNRTIYIFNSFKLIFVPTKQPLYRSMIWREIHVRTYFTAYLQPSLLNWCICFLLIYFHCIFINLIVIVLLNDYFFPHLSHILNEKTKTCCMLYKVNYVHCNPLRSVEEMLRHFYRLSMKSKFLK